MLAALIQDPNAFWLCTGAFIIWIGAMFLLAHLENKKFKK